MAAQRQRLPGLRARGFEHVGVQLVREELVGEALVDEDAVRELRRIRARDEFARIVLLPRFAVGAEITGERFFAGDATLTRAAQDHFYGERSGVVIDPFGHRWNIGHSIEEVTPEEMQRRYVALFPEG